MADRSSLDVPVPEPTAEELAQAEREQAEVRKVSVNAQSEHWGKPGYLTEAENLKLAEFRRAQPELDEVQV